jgi:hypothetical protein
MPKKMPRPMKYAWALLLSVAVGTLTLTERGSPWQQVLNGLIDALQHQLGGELRSLPGAGEIPASPGPLNFPTRQEVTPGTTNSPAIAAPDMAPAHQ